MQTDWREAVCCRSSCSAVEGMSVLFRRETIAADYMPLCPPKRICGVLWCNVAGMFKRKNLLIEFLDRDVQVERGDWFIAKMKKVSALLFMLPQLNLTLPFFSNYLIQVQDRSGITSDFWMENNHIGYYPQRSIIRMLGLNLWPKKNNKSEVVMIPEERPDCSRFWHITREYEEHTIDMSWYIESKTKNL